MFQKLRFSLSSLSLYVYVSIIFSETQITENEFRFSIKRDQNFRINYRRKIGQIIYGLAV